MLKLTFFKLLDGLFPVSAIATAIPEPKPFMHGFLLKKADFMDIPKTVDQLYASMNAVLPLGPPTEIYWSMTGEPYLECSARTGADNGSEARVCRWMWNKFIAQLYKQDDLSQARLYWRTEPEICEYDSQDYKPSPRDVGIYARYLISSRPVVVADTPQSSQDLLRLAGELGWSRPYGSDILISARI